MKQVAILYLSLGLATSCTHKAQAANSAQPRQNSRVIYEVLSASFAERQGQDALALNHYLCALRLSPDANLAQHTTALAIQLQDFRASQQAVALWLSVAPTTRPYLLQAILHLDEPKALESLKRGLIAGPDSFNDELLSLSASLGAKELKMLQKHLMQLKVSKPLQAVVDLSLAELFLQQGLLNQADYWLTLALDNKSSLRAVELKAALLNKEGGPLKALAFLNEKPERLANPGLRLLAASLYIEANDLERAKQTLAVLLKTAPAAAEALLFLGEIAIQEQNLSLAQHYFEQAQGMGGVDSDAQFMLAQICEWQGDLEKALKSYLEISQGPYVLSAQLRAVEILLNQGAYDLAYQVTQNMRAESTSTALAIELLKAEILLSDEQIGAARSVLEPLISNQSSDLRVLNLQSRLAYAEGQRTEAEHLLKHILSQAPQDVPSLVFYGQLLLEGTQPDLLQAATVLREAQRVSPQEPMVLDGLGWLAYHQGQYQAAEAFLLQAWQAQADPLIAAHLGEVLWTQGHRLEAQNIWSQASVHYPKHPILNATRQRYQNVNG